jgi:predicted transcriptional regulator
MRAADIMVPTQELVHPDQPLAEATARMHDAGLGLLPVVDGDELVGVITAADAADRPGDGTSVHDVMSTDIVFCYDQDDLPTALKIVEESGHPRLLVLNAEWELAGTLTAEAIRDAIEGGHDQLAGTARSVLRGRHVQSSVRQSPVDPGTKVSYRLRPTLRPRG